MKIQHIESGLGNQMLGYVEYLALKYANPDDNIYIENIIYDIEECNEVICQWNGYELEDIFGIKVKNIKEIFSEDEWQLIVDDIRKSNFWEKKWNYPKAFTDIFNRHGIDVYNMSGDFEKETQIGNKQKIIRLISRLLKNRIGYHVKKHISKLNPINNDLNEFPDKSEKNEFWGQRLCFKNKGAKLEILEKEIRETFKFPRIIDERNSEILKKIKLEESVAIHARRGDMLSINGECYKYGYFKRAVSHIKYNVSNPVFYIFCDPESVDWCKENEDIFGLDFKIDKVVFVDWNKGNESFRDMQLMSMCKHNIITNSSFGWWGAYLNENPNKITISPYSWLNTTLTLS